MWREQDFFSLREGNNLYKSWNNIGPSPFYTNGYKKQWTLFKWITTKLSRPYEYIHGVSEELSAENSFETTHLAYIYLNFNIIL